MELSLTALALPAFIAGLLTFLAPCTFPLVPAYLGFISGVSAREGTVGTRKKILINGLFYVLGFSAVFIIFGVLFGFLGQALVPYRIWLTRIAGVFIIFFGLSMLNIFKLPFISREWQPKFSFGLKRGRPFSSFLLGSAFAFGWTPCIGPVLGSILLVASTSSTALQGGMLLAIFSVGLAIPFLAVALAWGSATQYVPKISNYLWIVSLISGFILIAFGILLLTHNSSLLISWGYWIFQFINYEQILDYL